MAGRRYARVAPRSPREAALLDIWQTVLGHPVRSVTDNFFAAGGDSILSLQLISQVRSAGWLLTPKQIFENPTIAQQAQLMTACADTTTRAAERHDALPLTPIQAALGSAPMASRIGTNPCCSTHRMRSTPSA